VTVGSSTNETPRDTAPAPGAALAPFLSLRGVCKRLGATEALQGIDLEAYLDTLRAEMMRQALDRCGGVQTRAAELLRMSFRSFRYYAKKAGVVGSAGEGPVEEELEAQA